MGLKGRKDTLIAILKDKGDYYYASVEHWYRIPMSTRGIKKILSNDNTKYIAFYLSNSFGKNANKILWFAEIKKINPKIPRNELIPNEKNHKRAKKYYYKIEIGELQNLDSQIINLNHRKLCFLETRKDLLITAKELNDLIYTENSFIEEKLWDAFKKLGIYAERQWEIKNYKYRIDFALLTKKKNIAVECDGNLHHSKPVDKLKDDNRDRILKEEGWKTERIRGDEIINQLPQILNKIISMINNYGGLKNPESQGRYELIKPLEEKQMIHFDKH